MATLAQNLAATESKLKEAKAAYDMVVRNKESSTIVSRAKAKLDEAQKAYDSSKQQSSSPYNVTSTAGDELLKKEAAAKAKADMDAKVAADKGAADKKVRIESDPDVIAAKKLQAEAAAEVAATQKSIADAKNSLANLKSGNQLTALQRALQAAEEAAAKALKDKDAAAIAATQEAARVAAAAAAKEAQDKADQDARDADTAAKLAQAIRDRDAADAAAAAAEAASAEAIAAAKENINQSGNVGIPTTNLPDAAADMYAKELALKEANDTALAKRVSITETLTARFKSYGLETLASKVRDLTVDGATESTITLALQQTPEYKKRFEANEARVAKGLRFLEPNEYLVAEESYREVLRTYGLNQFDNNASVTQFIANDTSATEINARVTTAANRIKNADPAITKTLKDFYGLSDNELLGYVLDTKNQLPEILKKVTAGEIGAAARAQGLNADMTGSMELATQGVTQEQARAGYSTIAGMLPTAQKLGDIYGEEYTQATAEQDVFGQLASAKRKKESLRAREIGTFGGSAGTSKGSLTSKAAGQI